MSHTVTLGTLSITFTDDDVREAYKQPLTNKYDPDDMLTVIQRFVITDEQPAAHHQLADNERILQLIPSYLSEEELSFLVPFLRGGENDWNA